MDFYRNNLVSDEKCLLVSNSLSEKDLFRHSEGSNSLNFNADSSLNTSSIQDVSVYDAIWSRAVQRGTNKIIDFRDVLKNATTSLIQANLEEADAQTIQNQAFIFLGDIPHVAQNRLISTAINKKGDNVSSVKTILSNEIKTSLDSLKTLVDDSKLKININVIVLRHDGNYNNTNVGCLPNYKLADNPECELYLDEMEALQDFFDTLNENNQSIYLSLTHAHSYSSLVHDVTAQLAVAYRSQI